VFAQAEDLESNLANPRCHAAHDPQHSSFGVLKRRGRPSCLSGSLARPKVVFLGVPRRCEPLEVTTWPRQPERLGSASLALAGWARGQTLPELRHVPNPIVASGPNVCQQFVHACSESFHLLQGPLLPGLKTLVVVGNGIVVAQHVQGRPKQSRPQTATALLGEGGQATMVVSRLIGCWLGPRQFGQTLDGVIAGQVTGLGQHAHGVPLAQALDRAEVGCLRQGPKLADQDGQEFTRLLIEQRHGPQAVLQVKTKGFQALRQPDRLLGQGIGLAQAGHCQPVAAGRLSDPRDELRAGHRSDLGCGRDTAQQCLRGLPGEILEDLLQFREGLTERVGEQDELPAAVIAEAPVGRVPDLQLGISACTELGLGELPSPEQVCDRECIPPVVLGFV